MEEELFTSNLFSGHALINGCRSLNFVDYLCNYDNCCDQQESEMAVNFLKARR